MNQDTFNILLGGLVRHGLTVIATLFAAAGVTTAQQSSFVDAAAPLVISGLFFLGSQSLSYFSKKRALLTPPPVTLQ